MRFPVVFLCVFAALFPVAWGNEEFYGNALIGYQISIPKKWQRAVEYDGRDMSGPRLADQHMSGLSERDFSKPLVLAGKYPFWHTGMNPAFRMDLRKLIMEIKEH